LLCPQPAAPNELRHSLGLSDKFVVGYSGNFGRVHEFETVLSAVLALKSHPAIRFLFVGGGKQLPRIRAFVERERLENVVFASYLTRDRLAEGLAASDVHLCTLDPRFEGLVVPSKIYGIMAAGRPCLFVGDAQGEIGELLERGCCGWNIPPRQGDALAEAILKLSSDAQARGRMGEAARRIFEEEFDLPVAVRKWDRLLVNIAVARGCR
jgi:glycosyltransferase involved in cell wall biosynthesis